MPPFKIQYTPSAAEDLEKALVKYPQKRKKVKKAIGFLKDPGPSHPGLNTHTLKGKTAGNGETIYISYVENRTPQAWRIYWSYWGPENIKVLYVGPHE
ncbi:hypothetical protein FYJ89_02490 [Corynebacterium urealyticum]|nr:hypothetical protein FYJ89_02490 [Corynebacterium urealyticum]